ncbi:MAG: AMP-binding protein [Acidimicrobiales bacterium]
MNYTSGTTARPKGVEQTHRARWTNAVTFGWHAGVNDRACAFHTLPMFHCDGWGMLYTVTGMGVKHVVLRQIDGTEILKRSTRPWGNHDVCGPGRCGGRARCPPKLGRRDPRS